MSKNDATVKSGIRSMMQANVEMAKQVTAASIALTKQAADSNAVVISQLVTPPPNSHEIHWFWKMASQGYLQFQHDIQGSLVIPSSCKNHTYMQSVGSNVNVKKNS